MPHSYCCLLYHLVFSTKDRRPDLTVDIRQRVFTYTGGIIRSEKGILLTIGGTEDHVHLLARLRQDRALSEQLRDIKSRSSRWIHETFPDKKAFGWQGGYGAFAVSPSQVRHVQKYIENQESHHRKMDFRTEFLRILEKHGVEYDERYIWH